MDGIYITLDPLLCDVTQLLTVSEESRAWDGPLALCYGIDKCNFALFINAGFDSGRENI